MWRSTRYVLLVLLTLIPLPLWAQAPYHWSQVKIPGAVDTLATGTNDGSWVVGNYFSRNGGPSGSFRFQKNKFTEFTVPGAAHVEVKGIGKASAIVGHYWTPDANPDQPLGFLYLHSEGGRVVTLDVPDSWATEAWAVNDHRQVAISYLLPVLPFGQWAAGVYDDATGAFTPVEAFGHVWTTITGINNHGDLTGFVLVPTDDPASCACEYIYFAFYRGQGQDHLLVPPEWARAVLPNGLNDHGVVVGSAWTEEGLRGFRVDLTTGAWEQIVHPSKQEGYEVEVMDIDNQGRMVATHMRQSDGYTQSWWIRPKGKVNVASK